jgi:drug/metabolite transporter (DMT)-like permease
MGNETKGMLIGAVGVLIFSLTLPFTRIAVLELNPLFVAFGRALLAGLCALGWLYFSKAQRPTKTPHLYIHCDDYIAVCPRRHRIGRVASSYCNFWRLALQRKTLHKLLAGGIVWFAAGFGLCLSRRRNGFNVGRLLAVSGHHLRRYRLRGRG